MEKEIRKVLVSGMIGNALEWYDFVLFVQFAPFIGKLFFPAQDNDASLLAVLGVFAAGFIMRPIGGILFGYLGDKFGRKASLVFSILMMSVPTAFIGILPTYEMIGIWAPILLTLIRLMQGVALGGGFSGCMTFLVEHAPADKRGIMGSASMFSLGAGVLLGIVITSIFSYSMNVADFERWGWRIPFLISIIIGLVAFYIKNNVNESPVYEQAKQHGKLSKTPVREVFKSYLKPLLVAIGVYLTVTVPFYTFSAFFNTFMQKEMHFSLHDTMTINGIAISMFMLSMPLSGYLSDKFGRKMLLKYSAIAIALSAYPVFCLLISGSFQNALFGQVIFGIFLGFYMAPVPATLVELFPTSVRFTGLALSYNISAALFGGTAPFIYVNLIKFTGSKVAPAFYIMFFVTLTLVALKGYKDKNNLQLDE